MQAQDVHLQTMLNLKSFEVPGAKKTLVAVLVGIIYIPNHN
jgi:hypothetical protein